MQKEKEITLPASILTQEERLALPLRALYEKNGYRRFRVSKFEPYELYLENRTFITGRSILTFTDIGGKLKALKPDVTLSVLKNYKGGNRKLWYDEKVYREGESSHEFAEISQVGVECLGEIDRAAEREVLEMAKESLRLLGARTLLDVASVELLRAAMEESGLSPAGRRRLTALLREKNHHEVLALCAEEKVPERPAKLLGAMASCYGDLGETLKALRPLCGERSRTALEELSSLQADDLLPEEKSRGGALRLDFSIIDDLDYYTGLVFKGYLEGVPSPVLSGGRYDRLLWKFGGRGGAIGFAVYLDRLVRRRSGEEREA